MAREYLRPFSKMVRIADADAHIIELKDTAGTFLECNYVTVEAVSGGGNSVFLATPSGIQLSAANDKYVASSMLGVASGTFGLVSNNAGGSVVLGLAPYDSVKAIVLSQDEATAVTYVVSYGNVALSNQLQDGTASRGG